MSNWWDSAPLAPEPQSSGAPKPLLDLRDPSKQQGMVNDQTRTNIAVESNERTKVKDERDYNTNTAIKLSDNYNANAQVKAYEASWPMFVAALKTKPNRAEDQLLITSIAKLTDPTTGVLGGEREGVPRDSQSWVDTKQAELRSLLDQEGGVFSDETRNRLRGSLINLMNQRNKAYNAQRLRYKADAEAYGLDPDRVIGPHVGTGDMPFMQQYEAQRSGQAARDPNMVGGLAEGTNITFAGDDGSGFDRNKWLMETTGFDPNGEANLVAWMSANSGNPNITKEDVQAAYRRFSDNRSSGSVDDAFMEKFRAQKTPWQGFDSSFAENQLKVKAEQLAQERDTVAGGVDAFVRGAAQVPSFGLADKAQALTDTVFNGGTYAENMDQQRLINTADDIANPWASTAGEVTGAVLAPYGAGARTPMELAKVGAVTSGATEFNQSSAPFSERLLPTALATATGGALGYGTGKAVEKLAPYAGPALNYVGSKMPSRTPNPEGAAYYDAAVAAKVVPDAMDVGGRMTKRIGKATEQSPYGANAMGEARDATINSFEARLNELAKETGVGAVGDEFGGKLAENATAVLNKAKAKATVKYTRASEAVGAEGVNAVKARSALANEITTLERTGLSSKIRGVMQDVANKMDEGPMDVDTLRLIRTRMRQDFVDAGSTPKDAKAMAERVNRSITEDIVDTLTAKGKPEFAADYAAADVEWRAMSELRDKVFEPIIGKAGSEKSGEAVVKALLADLKGNNARAVKFLKALPKEQQQETVASLIQTLGRNNSKADDTAGFSMGKFLSNWENIGGTAKAAYFTGELASALDNLALVAKGSRLSGQMAGHSNSGAINAANFTNGGLASAMFALFTGHPIVAAGLATPAIQQKLTAMVMTSPRFVHWLAAAGKKPVGNEAAARQHVNRLSSIAKAEPVIANEVLQLQARLRGIYEQGQMPLAANPGEEKGTPLPSAKTNTAGEPQ